MNLIDFLQAGGYRLKQATFRKMQESYFELLKAFVKHLDMSDVGNYIISGCTIVGANITSGIVYIDGELCLFEGGVGTVDTEIKKNIVITNLPFKNGSNLPVFRATNAIIDVDGVPLSDFIRVPLVKALVWGNISGIPVNLVYDSDYVHTDVNFTTAKSNLLAKFDTPDFNITNPATPGYIKNKPTGSIQTFLHKGNYPFADISTDANLTVTFADVGTTNYMVVGTLVSLGMWNNDNDILWMVKDKTATSFKLLLREVSGNVQNVSLDYMIIPL